jgi:homopolymeric O-antigen transport system ATP-binding protein
MARILVQNLSVYFPIGASGGTQITREPPPGNMVTIKGKRYLLALNNLNLDISQGQRVGLVGKNGSGKSTLLRVLGGIYPPSAGRIACSGKISSMFNLNLGIQTDATGRENIVTRGIIRGWSRREIERLMPDIIEFSELGEFIDLPIRTYSDGMRMRLLFAVATSFEPDVLLLDEWIGAGDANFQKKAAARMRDLVGQSGITVIASHNRKLLSSVCDVGVWLEHGVVKALGPIGEVYAAMDAAFARQAN